MKKSLAIIIVVGIAILIILAVAGYFFFFNRLHNFKGNFPRNIQLDETQINEVNNFFASNPNNQQINDYCNANRQNCFYYCRTNQEDSYCRTMMNMTGNRSAGGMYDRIHP